MLLLSQFSHVQLFATPWTIVFQAPLSMGILQARILEWVVMPSSRESSQPREGTCVSYVSCIGRQVFYHWYHLGSPLCSIRNCESGGMYFNQDVLKIDMIQL